MRKEPECQRSRRQKKDKNPDRPMRQTVETRIPRPHLPLLGVLHLPSVFHAGKFLKGGVEASIRGKCSKIYIPPRANGCIILHSWAGELRIPAPSNLKRPC